MSILETGVYANSNTPLWLSALTPVAGPNNLQVSTLTVNATGGVIMVSDNDPYPASGGAPVLFNRITGEPPTALQQAPSKDVPTKSVETTYLASVTNGGTVYDDIALQGLQIYGPQVVLPSANTGAAGYLTQGPLPFSVELYTGAFYTGQTQVNIGNFSTINVSSIFIGGGEVVPDPLVISSIQASSITTNTLATSSILASFGSFSTASISSFVLPSSFVFGTLTGSTINVDLINASTMNISTISSGTIISDVGTFSTLNAPGFGGGSTINTSTVTASSITTGLLSTVIAVTKEIFVSTMTFNATLSPNLDLGLGGIIGGLAGGFGANALSVGLGAGGLATGIAALAMSRQSGGINPSVFQTVNGTSQLQFSTLGTPTTTTLTITDSVNPDTTPGNPVNITTIIPSGTYCMRTISDPLNLPNSSGTSGLGIQGFSQWTPVYSGKTQLINNIISSVSGNSIEFGDTVPIPGIPNQPMIFNTGPNTGANIGYFQFNGPILGTTLGLGPTFGSGGLGEINAEQSDIRTSLRANNTFISSITAYDYNALIPVALSTVGIYPGIITSTIAVSSFTIGNARFQNLTVSTITASTITSGPITTTTLSAPGGINVGPAVILSANIPNLAATAIIGVSSINGSVYPPVSPSPPPVSPVPTGTVIVFAGQNAPTGYLICDGASYSQVTYANLYAVILANYGSVSPGFFSVPDLRTRTVFGSTLPTFGTPFLQFTITAIDFSVLQTLYPGTVVPNGTAATGRQALAVLNIPGGQELVDGMFITYPLDPTIYFIKDILNYQGNSGSYAWPNFPIIILNTPLVVPITAATTFTIIPATTNRYTHGNSYEGNLITQTESQVGNHSHSGGATNGSVNAFNTSNNPLMVNANTGSPNSNHYYTIGQSTIGFPAEPFPIACSMPVVPSFVAMNWIIKT